MKNIKDELKKLNEYEYNVSEDFTKNVMDKIHKKSNKNNITYVVSVLSAGMVACLAVFLFKVSDNQIVPQRYVTKNINSNSVENISEKNGINNKELLLTKNTQAQKNDIDFDKNLVVKEEKLSEEEITLKNKFEKSGFLVEITEKGLKIKAKIKDILEIIENQENLVIEQNGEWIYIHKQNKN